MAAPDANGRPGPSLTHWERARIAYGLAAQRASDYARALVPTVGDQDMKRGEWVKQARRHRTYSIALTDAAVFLELADGASWQEVADDLALPVDVVRERYEQRVTHWLAGEPTPGGPRLADGAAVALFPDAHEGDVSRADAERLDRWYIHTAPPLDSEARRVIASTGDAPFSRNLRRG